MDFNLLLSGSLAVLVPMTIAAQVFAQTMLVSPETVEYGGGIVVEHRYVDDVIVMLDGEGFEVEVI